MIQIDQSVVITENTTYPKRTGESGRIVAVVEQDYPALYDVLFSDGETMRFYEFEMEPLFEEVVQNG